MRWRNNSLWGRTPSKSNWEGSMRRLFPGIALAALLFVGSFGARAGDYGHPGPFGGVVPGMSTGCFGERYPILQLVMPPGYGYGDYNGAAAAPYGWEERRGSGYKGQGGRKGVEVPGGGKI